MDYPAHRPATDSKTIDELQVVALRRIEPLNPGAGSQLPESVDVAIVGAGIVGLATSFQVQQKFPGLRVAVFEKEAAIGLHQTSHNSGVLHSGVYYRPGSLRAANCLDGRAAMVAFCEAEGIAFETCGKLIVATERAELPMLDRIFERGRANGVRCEMVEREDIAALEPYAAGIRAIHVPDAGIVDYLEVAQALARRVERADGSVHAGARLESVTRTPGGLRLATARGEVEAAYLICCAGLQSDRVAALTGVDPPTRIVPFRGEYFTLTPAAEHLCRSLIYPVPDPDFPFLGVHFTRMVRGGVECGPNAVLALAREGYSRGRIVPRDAVEIARFEGFRKLARKHWRAGLGEMWRSFSKAAFVRALQRLIPEISSEHLIAAPSGIRAQAVDRGGSLLDDFLIVEAPRIINVCNAPSPAATASLAIGAHIAGRLANQMA